MTIEQERMIATIDSILESESRSRHNRKLRTAEAAHRLLTRLRQTAFQASGLTRGWAL